MVPETDFVPLELERRAHLDTATAAVHLHHSPKVLRGWAATGKGPLQPVRIGRKLLWPTDRLRELLQIEAA